MNVLAYVGHGGVAQLWDIVFHQPLGQSFERGIENNLTVCHFTRDGKYLVYSGDNCEITPWMAKDIAPELAVSVFATILRVIS